MPGGADADLGVPDPRAAVPLFAAAARSGNMDAALTLARLYDEGAEGVPPQRDLCACVWTRIAAEAGHSPAIAPLAYLRERGIRRARRPRRRAQGLYRRA